MQTETIKATRNSSMLFLMNIAKMFFPFITMPYLFRIITVEGYAVVTYVKAVMQYAQIVLMFGFTLSATKDIVNAKGDKYQIGVILGAVLEAKGLLAAITGAVIFVLTITIPLLRENPLYVLLAFIGIVITEMQADFLFKGIDKMEGITIRFVVAKLISTLLTFVFIKSDRDILLIPVFDILGSSVALILVFRDIRKMGFQIILSNFTEAIRKLKESAIYFASDMATTAFGALNTLLVGLLVSKTDVSYWGLCMQLISAVQSLYTPITNGIYPSMVRTKSLKFLKRILLIFMPIIVIGCVMCVLLSSFIVRLIGGPQYVDAASYFKVLVPILFFSFPGMLLGWPALGTIGKQRETTMTTFIASVFQVLGLLFLILIGRFSLISIAILRDITEALLMVMRASFCFKFRKDFAP